MLDHKYKVFYHLAQTPNTTKVAEELLLSQPAISKNIKELEKELGITLFNVKCDCKSMFHFIDSEIYFPFLPN